MHLHTLWRQTKKTSCDSTLALTLWHQNPKKSTIAFTLWRQSKKTHRIYQNLHSLSGANLSKTHRNQHMHSPSSPQTPRNHQHFHPPSGAKTPRKFINDCIHQPNKLQSYIAHTHTDFMHNLVQVPAHMHWWLRGSWGENFTGLKIQKGEIRKD